MRLPRAGHRPIGVLVYSVVHIAILFRRSRGHSLERDATSYVGAAILDLATLVAVAPIVTYGTFAAYETLLLLLLLLSPMLAFLLVLASLEPS